MEEEGALQPQPPKPPSCQQQTTSWPQVTGTAPERPARERSVAERRRQAQADQARQKLLQFLNGV